MVRNVIILRNLNRCLCKYGCLPLISKNIFPVATEATMNTPQILCKPYHVFQLYCVAMRRMKPHLL